MNKKLSLLAMIPAFVASALAGPPSENPRLDVSSMKQHRGVKLTPEQAKVVEAVSGFNRNSNPLSKGGNRLVRLKSGAGLQKSPMKVNASGSNIQGWRISDEYGSTPSGWYELNFDGSEKLLWEYHDPNWEDDGWNEEPAFPFNSGFYKDNAVIGFHGEMLLYWLLWGYGSFSLDGEILEHHEYGDDLSITDFSTYVISCVYDENIDKAYAYTLNSEATGYMLQSIDLDTWSFSPVVTDVAVEDVCLGFAYNPENKMIYGVTPDSRFVNVNTTNGTLSTIAKFDFPVTNSIKGLTYSPLDKAFAFVYCDGWEDASLYLITPQGEITYLADLPEARQYNILVTPDKIVDNATPTTPEIISVDFPEGNLDGAVSLKMPELTFGGDPISGELTLCTFIDDNLRDETTAKPGEEITVGINNVEEGLRTFSFSVKSGEFESASVKKTVYIGYDTPLAPSNIVLSEGELQWDAVTGCENSGYLDANRLTYNVYLNGNKINSSPIAECSYKFNMPDEEFRKYVAQVEADNHGHISERGFSNDIKAGKPFSLPFSMQPTQAEGELVKIFSQTGGWDRWDFSQDENNPHFYCNTFSYDESQEWIILPALTIPASDKLLEISFEVLIQEGYSENENNENFTLAFGKEQLPESMTSVKEWTRLNNTEDWQTISAWCLPEAGLTYFGFMTKTHEEGGDVMVRNIHISLSDRSATTPSEVTELKAVSMPDAELKAEVTFKMPEISAANLPLENKDLTATVTTEVESLTVSGKPGSQQTIKIATVQGWNDITVIPSNENQGLDNSVRIYTGMDVPKPLDKINVTHSKDYKSLHLEWNAPTEGYNGGYVNPSEVEYALCLYNEDTYEWEIAQTLGNVTQFDFAPNVSDNLILSSGAILTSNKEGSSGIILTFESPTGTPYELPMIENLNDENSWEGLYTPVTLEKPDESYSAEWGFIIATYPYWVSLPTPYGSAAFIAFGSEGEKARINLPAFSTKGIESVAIELPIWCGPQAAEIAVYAEAYGIEPELLGSFSDFTEDAWRKHRFHLTDKFLDKEWVNIKVDAIFHGEEETRAAFADYRIKTFQRNDVGVTNITAPIFAICGEEASIKAEIENMGIENVPVPEMELIVTKDDKILTTISMTPEKSESTLDELGTMTYTASWTPDGEACGEVIFTARCATSDMDNQNNSRSAACTVSVANSAAISDLSAITDGDDINLSWTEPELKSGFEGFENYASFYYDDKIGEFRNISLDGLNSTYFAAFRFPYDENAKGWQVLGEKEMTDIIEEAGVENEYVHANSGNNVIAAFTPFSLFVGENLQADKWLISPEIKGGTALKFMLSSGVTGYEENVEILYSSTNASPESFETLDKLLLLTAKWVEYEYQLPEDARYFAIRYCGVSGSGFFVILDDINFEPLKEGTTLTGYDILRDNNTIRECVAANGSWIDNYTLPSEGAYYNIIPVLRREGKEVRGVISNTAYASLTSVATVDELNAVISTGKGFINIKNCADNGIKVYSPDGLLVNSIKKPSDNETIAVAQGIYVVEIGNAKYKVAVK